MGSFNHRLRLSNMKINVAYPATGCQKLFEINDEHKVRPFYEKRMGAEVDASTLGEEWNGYIFRITGGNDKQGFPMKQGVLTQGRVRLLLSKGHSCYRARKTGKENENPFVVALLTDNSLSCHAPLSRREKVRSPDSPITPSHEDLDPKEHLRSGNCLTCQRTTMYPNSLSSAHFPPRKARSKSIRHQRFNVWSPQSCCNARDTD